MRLEALTGGDRTAVSAVLELAGQILYGAPSGREGPATPARRPIGAGVFFGPKRHPASHSGDPGLNRLFPFQPVAAKDISEVMVFSANEILDMAIRLEKNGEAVYRAALEKVRDPDLSLLLEWMADEEVRHARWFSNMRSKLILESPDPQTEKIGRDMLDNLMAGQSFSLEEVDFSRIDHINAMLATFIEFETDTILFYQMLEAFIQEEPVLAELKKIVAEEERHIEKLKTLRHREAPAASAG